MRRKPHLFCALVFAGHLLTAGTSYGAFLYANNFTSLGSFTAGASFQITTSNFGGAAPSMNIACDGSAGTCNGVFARRDGTGGACTSDADCIAVFTFSDFTLNGKSITFDNANSSLPVAILSQGDMSLSAPAFSTINLNAEAGTQSTPGFGGPGGGSGGNGPGAGGDSTDFAGGGGGGFGGAGGAGESSGGTGGTGGPSYNANNLMSSVLEGGSGGGNAVNGSKGGGGGGAIELGALGTLTIKDVTIDALGGAGGTDQAADGGAGGGGSGGAVLIHANIVDLSNGFFSDTGFIRTTAGNGGNKGSSNFSEGSGGGGGGGRIYVAAATSVLGVSTPLTTCDQFDFISNGGIGQGGAGNGSIGTCLVEINATAIPESSTYAALFALFALGFVAYRKIRQ